MRHVELISSDGGWRTEARIDYRPGHKILLHAHSLHRLSVGKGLPVAGDGQKEVSMLLRIMRRILETEMTQKIGRRSSGVNERAGRLNPGVHAEVLIRA
jgi:hypothetical protein